MPEVIPLRGFADQADQVGIKLRRLASLAGWGYRVPDGFALTPSAVSQIAARDDARFPDGLSAALTREYEALCRRLGQLNPALAVRSAATAEDSERRSFAGVFDSVLGVRGLSQIDTAIRTCIASLNSPRAEFYAGHDVGSMTVGVQELIDARASGVLFSRHPVTNRTDRIVIEGVLGLGTTMIDGVARPDHIEVGRSDGRVLRYDVGDKQCRATPRERGGLNLEQPSERERQARCLDAGSIEELSRAAIDLEARFGHAVDLEWVLTGDGELVMVQVRPITGGPARAPIQWDPVAYARRARNPRGGH